MFLDIQPFSPTSLHPVSVLILGFPLLQVLLLMVYLGLT